MRSILNLLLLSTCLFSFCILFTGCEESCASSGSDSRRASLVGNENMQLKAQLAKQEALLAQCQKDKKASNLDAEKTSGEMMDMLGKTLDMNKELKDTNAKLKAKIVELEK